MPTPFTHTFFQTGSLHSGSGRYEATLRPGVPFLMKAYSGCMGLALLEEGIPSLPDLAEGGVTGLAKTCQMGRDGTASLLTVGHILCPVPTWVVNPVG